MAKKRKSVFDGDVITEVQTAAKKIQSTTIERVPDNKISSNSSKGNVPQKKKDRYKVVYIDQDYHHNALVNATVKGLKLGRYIEMLIDKDMQ